MLFPKTSVHEFLFGDQSTEMEPNSSLPMDYDARCEAAALAVESLKNEAFHGTDILLARMHAIHAFLTDTLPAEGSRPATGGVS